MNSLLRRIAALVVLLGLIALVTCDLWVGSVRAFWAHHSFTGSVVASSLLLGVTGLVVDELVARRQRNDRALSVAVQGLIVYGQTRRVYEAVLAVAEASAEDRASRHGGEGASSVGRGDAYDDLRSLANMLLTVSANFFDDPLARQFLERVERLTGTIVHVLGAEAGGRLDPALRDVLVADMTSLQAIAEPLIARIPPRDWPLADRPEPG